MSYCEKMAKAFYREKMAKAFNDLFAKYGVEEEIVTPDDVTKAIRQKRGWVSDTEAVPVYYLPDYPKLGLEITIDKDFGVIMFNGLRALIKYREYEDARPSSYIKDAVKYIQDLKKVSGRKRLLDI